MRRLIEITVKILFIIIFVFVILFQYINEDYDVNVKKQSENIENSYLGEKPENLIYSYYGHLRRKEAKLAANLIKPSNRCFHTCDFTNIEDIYIIKITEDDNMEEFLREYKHFTKENAKKYVVDYEIVYKNHHEPQEKQISFCLARKDVNEPWFIYSPWEIKWK